MLVFSVHSEMSLIEGDESAFKFQSLMQSAIPKIDPLSVKKGEYRDWEDLLLQKLDIVGVSFLLKSVCVPACTVCDTVEEKKKFFNWLGKVVTAHRYLRLKAVEAVPSDLRKEAMQQGLTKSSKFIEEIEFPDEATRAESLKAVTSHVDPETKDQYVDRLPLLGTVAKYLKGRLTARTPMERQQLWNSFMKMKWDHAVDFPQFWAKVLDHRKELLEANIKIDDMAVRQVVAVNLPQHAEDTMKRLCEVDDRTLPQISEALETYFRNYPPWPNNAKSKQSRPVEEIADALAVLGVRGYGDVQGSRDAGAAGGRGRGSWRARGGRGRGVTARAVVTVAVLDGTCIAMASPCVRAAVVWGICKTCVPRLMHLYLHSQTEKKRANTSVITATEQDTQLHGAMTGRGMRENKRERDLWL